MIPNMKIERTQKEESNDCCVFALAAVLGCSYEQSRNILNTGLRQVGSGVRCADLGRFLREEVGMELVPIFDVSLKEVRELFPMGKYFLRTHNHALALVNGNVIDCNGESKHLKIERIYRK